VGPSFDEIAVIENGRDITRGWVNGMGMYLPTQDSLLNLKSGGDLKLYEQVAQDDRVKSCLQQRFSGLTSKEFEVIPGGEKRIDKQAADYIKLQLEALNWDDITEKMQWGVFYGYSIAEILWKQDGERIGIDDIRVRNRRRFHFGIDQQPKLISFDRPLGEDLPAQKFWHFCCGADHHDEPYGRGIAHWLYWPTWFKRNDLRWWITFLENFADPSTLGSYPTGATEQEKATLRAAVQSVGKKKWAIKPEGMLMEYLEATRSGTADYQAMYDSINTSITQIILSQSMTTENGSSLSQAQVHQDVGDAVVEADDALISSSFNAGPVKWLTDWNFPGAAYPRVCRQLEAAPDLKALAERDKIIVDMGFPANPEYIVETYGEGFKPIESESVPVSLNGAQLQAFVSLISQAQQGGWSSEMVRVSLQIAFPHVPDGLLDEMAKSMKSMPAPGADPSNPQSPTSEAQTPEQAAQSLDAVAAQFAAALDEVALQFEVEFKIKEGTTKEVNGKQYILKNSRWCRADAAPKAEKKPRTATSKPLTEAKKNKKEKILKDAGIESKPKENKPNAKKKVEPKVEPKASKSSNQQIKTNQRNLNAAHAKIVAQAGEEAVKKAEANAAQILASKDTGVFVKLPSHQVLGLVLGNRFRNSVELNGNAAVPGLEGSYQDARKRVEQKQMGYPVDYDPALRPTYAYMGNAKHMSSASHQQLDTYGDITLKLKDSVKDRATFTGADSFKGGVASSVQKPSAASLVQSYRHGHPFEMLDAKGDIDRVAKAKGIDDLMAASTGGGNRYVEAQIHGQVTNKDIAEIHFKSSGEPGSPDAKTREWAKANGVKIFKDGEPYEHLEVSPVRQKQIAKTLTPDKFKDYLVAKTARLQQQNPDATHNQTYSEWKERQLKLLESEDWKNPNHDPFDALDDLFGSSKSKPTSSERLSKQEIVAEIAKRTSPGAYVAALDRQVDDGQFISKKSLASIPTTGKDKISQGDIDELTTKSSAAESAQKSKSQLHKELDAILDKPLVSDADIQKYKPTMSEKEALEYTKGSVFGGHTFYHGGSQAAIDSISGSGVKISANQAGAYGGGFYMGAVEGIADSYGSGGMVASLKVNVKNPFVMDKIADIAKVNSKIGDIPTNRDSDSLMKSAFGNRFGDPGKAHWAAMLKIQGYDGIYVKENGYAVGFEKEQMVTTATRKSKAKAGSQDPNSSADGKKLNTKLKASI
jgi:phage gp29-like protein